MVASVQKLQAEQVEAAASTLALAFHDDPLLQILQPDEAKRPAVGRWFLGAFVRYGLPFGQVWANGDASAVAVWLPPGKTDVSTLGMLRVGLGALPLKVGLRGTARIMRGMSVTEPFHKAVDGPHWYLGMVGTRPERQGQGLGQALLAAGTDQADTEGLPCYLETGTEANLAFYSKRGFEVTGEAEAEGVTVWAMVRQPQPTDRAPRGGNV